MHERGRQRAEVVLAIALVLGAAWLLYAGASYVSAWMTYEAHRPGPVTCVFCPVVWALLPPSPGVVTMSYVVAIPAFLGVGGWFHRGRPTRLRLVGSDSLIGAMGWMALLIAIGAVWPFLPFASVVWSLFLISVLVVPPIVGAVGGAFLWEDRRRSRSIPSRASGE